MNKIIFVCTGNICRSVVAQKYMEKKLFDMGISKDYCIDSCGILADNNKSASKTAITVMKDYGINLEIHKSKNMNLVNFNDYDLILTMTYEQKLNILLIHRKLKNKVFTLKEYVNNKFGEYIDIDDPWGLDYDVHRYTYEEIMKYIDKLILKIKDVKL